MKKTILLAALALAAGTALATAQTDYSGVYSGELTVSLVGTPAPQDIEIYNGSEENTITFVLPKFAMVGGEDIVLTDVPVADGSMTLENYVIYIAALSNTATVSMNEEGSMFNGEELNVDLTITTPILPIPIGVTFEGTRTLAANEGVYQVRNSGFEGEWEKVSGKGGIFGSTTINGVEPQHWNSFVTASVGSGFGLAQAVTGDQLTESSDVRPGSKGVKSALVLSKWQMVAAANGNLTTGKINAGAMDPASVLNHNASDTANGDGFICPFVGVPDSLSVWMKYAPVEGKESTKAKVSAIIHNNQRYQDPEDKDYSDVKVAMAVDSLLPTNGAWQRMSVPFVYNYLPSDSAKNILVSFSTNTIPGGGNVGDGTPVDQLWVDDLEMIYNSELSSLTVGDEEVTLEAGVYAYDLMQELAADANPEVTAVTNGKAATHVVGFNRANNTAAVIVRGGDFAANPANVHTYLLSFADPQGPGTGFDAPVVPQVSLYTEGNMLYILSAEAMQVEVYAVDGRLLTLTNEQVISLPSNGVYVVRVNGETHKVVAQ